MLHMQHGVDAAVSGEPRWRMPGLLLVAIGFVLRLHTLAGGLPSGCGGTLVTPRAANFNIVPVRLPELKSDFAVIRAQGAFCGGDLDFSTWW